MTGLLLSFGNIHPEAGCDEAGRGCFAGPVFAAAVILPPDFNHPLLNDSKQVKEANRVILKKYIEENAVAHNVAMVDVEEIDRINILKASFTAMHKAIDGLKKKPSVLLIDGNRFIKYKKISHHCIIKGDGKYASIAAASILAKTRRDEPSMAGTKTKGTEQKTTEMLFQFMASVNTIERVIISYPSKWD